MPTMADLPEPVRLRASMAVVDPWEASPSTLRAAQCLVPVYALAQASMAWAAATEPYADIAIPALATWALQVALLHQESLAARRAPVLRAPMAPPLAPIAPAHHHRAAAVAMAVAPT